MEQLTNQNPRSYSLYFVLKIWFRARNVIGTFEKQALGHLGLVRLINISNKFFEKILGEWTICEAEKPVIKFGEKGKRKEKNWQSRTCSRKRKTFALHTKIVKPYFSFTGLCPFINKYSLTIKLYPGFFLIFIINMGSLKNERIDSTETTNS